MAELVSLSAEKDNTIFEEDDAKSCGACDTFIVGVNGGDNVRRALIEFDVSSIPANSTITNVEFEFVVSKANALASVEVMDIHKVMEEWGEAGSIAVGGGSGDGTGGPAFTGDATWTDAIYDDTVNWISAGGDFEASPSASVTLSAGLGTFTTISTASMVSDVQGWVNGTNANHGWLLKLDFDGEGDSSTARAIDSRTVDVGTPPILRVNYTSPNPDTDMDGIPDDADNCPVTHNPGQEDNYGTTAGDACEDTDVDTVLDDTDNCPTTHNPGQEDNYGTTAGDACEDTDVDTVLDDADNCPVTHNPGQEDNYGTTAGDACEDTDVDSVLDDTDNCPTISNLDQYNLDNDAFGNVCDSLTSVGSSQTISDCMEFGGDLSVTGGVLLTFTANGKAIIPLGSNFSVLSTSGALLTVGSSIHISNSVEC